MAKKTEAKIGLFGGGFDPAGLHHRTIANVARRYLDRVIVIPSGIRADKEGGYHTANIHRARMAEMTFRDLPDTEVDLFDIHNETFMPSVELEKRYRDEGEIWHIVGSDWIIGGREGRSVIQETWQQGRKLWQNSRFMVIQRSVFPVRAIDLPPCHGVFMLDLRGSSSEIRERVANGLSVSGLVVLDVERYIRENGLYLKNSEKKEEAE